MRNLRQSLHTSLGRKRLVGILLLVLLLGLFFALNRFPKLDAVGADIDAVTGTEIQCFQGFCIERDAGESFVERWFTFSLTYLELVTVGMTFAFLVAGLAESFFFPPGTQSRALTGSGFKRTLKGMAIGPMMNLCSACVVPVSASFQRRGGGIEGAIALVQGSATMNIPALSMVFFVFTPVLGFSRLILAVVGAILIGPIVVAAVRRMGAPPAEEEESIDVPVIELAKDYAWRTILREGLRDWARSSLGYVARLGPIMIVAGFASGLFIQWLSPSTVSTYLGNNVFGVVLAATFGILINVPLLFEIPLVGVLILMGMGTAPAATLLFTAAAGGPVTFFGLAKFMPKRAIATFATATWALGAIGGVAVLGLGAMIWEDVGEGALKVAPAPGAAEEARQLGREPPSFEEVAAQAGVAFEHSRDGDFFNLGGGAAAADFNNDGWLDLYATNSNGPNALYLNNGDGTFRDIAQRAGVADETGHGNGAAWGDYDNDSLLDLFVANFGSSRLFRNNGDETFTDVTAAAGVVNAAPDLRTMGVAWGDFDADGFLDLLIVRHVNPVGPLFTIANTGQVVLLNRCRTEEFYANPVVPRGVIVGDPHDFSQTGKRDFTDVVRPLVLYRNSGDGTFADVTHLLGDGIGHPSNLTGAGFKPSFLDYDGDGDLDIYVVNDFGAENFPNVLWRNDGPDGDDAWEFSDVSVATGTDTVMYGMGLAAGDYDNDGDLDFYMTDIGASRFLENRDGVFEDVTESTGTGRGFIPENGEVNRSVGWGTAFVDLDNDGFLDLYQAAGYIDTDPCANHPNQPNVVFVNKGDGTFVDVSKSSGADDPGIGREVVYGDFNNDGRLDLYVVNMGTSDGAPGIARFYLNADESGNSWLQVKPIAAAGNRFAVGAKVVVTVDGVTRLQYVGLSQGHVSQSITPVHFGLGDATHADLVEVHWPDGGVQSFTDVPVNQVFTAVRSP